MSVSVIYAKVIVIAKYLQLLDKEDEEGVVEDICQVRLQIAALVVLLRGIYPSFGLATRLRAAPVQTWHRQFFR